MTNYEKNSFDLSYQPLSIKKWYYLDKYGKAQEK